MEPKRQRELVLASIALVVLAIAAWTMRAAGRPATSSAPSGGAPAGNAQTAKGPAAGVNLEALETERPEPEEATRNPFRFKTAPAPPRLPTQAQPQPSSQQQQSPLATTGPPQPPPPPRIPLKYIGDVADPGKPGAKIAVLSDGRNVYQGREGDIVEGRYRIVRIGVESVDLAYLDGRGRQTIRQTGQ